VSAAPFHELSPDRDRVPPIKPHDLSGCVALVTGASRGIGQRLATRLAGGGAAVGLIARSEIELRRTEELIEKAGGTAAAATADVTDPAGLQEAIDRLRRRLGRFDLLVNNAGILGPVGPLWEVDADAWWTTMNVNVRGLVLCTRFVVPDMIAAGSGRVINVTSQAGVHRWPLVSGYSVSKAAAVKLTENLALEAGRYGISVFSVHPGLLPIGMSETAAGNEPTTSYERRVRDWALGEIAAGRGADPTEAIELLMRLASGEGDRLSGRHLSVHDDLDNLLARIDEVRSHDLYVLRPERLRQAS
jgi:NAD(P)-dependent dehydrogenase (short-subunit alcohol dehydrogenase family)